MNGAVNIPLNQNQFDALVSLAYNINLLEVHLINQHWLKSLMLVIFAELLISLMYGLMQVGSVCKKGLLIESSS